MDDNVRIGVAEAFGTCVLVLGGCGTAVYAGAAVGAAGVATAFGLSLLIMAYVIGPISGCHINPAVTLGMVMAKKTDASKVPFYVGGQIAGGLIGGFLLFLTFELGDVAKPDGFATNGFGDFSPSGFGLGGVAIVEILMTALLVIAVLSTMHSKFPPQVSGVVAGFSLWLIHLISIPVSNTSVNPARSIAVAPFADGSDAMVQVWAFIVFPLIGAALGAVIWNVLNTDETKEEVI